MVNLQQRVSAVPRRSGRAGLRIALLLLSCGLSACVTSRPPSTAGAYSSGHYSVSVPGQASDVVIRAVGLIGTPYRWGGNTPDSGFDCSGLVRYIYHDAAGLTLPRTSQQMAGIAAPTVARRDLSAGDLVFFGRGRSVTHVGIYVGEGRFVHAPNKGGTVRIDPLSGPYWQDRYLYARRPL